MDTLNLNAVRVSIRVADLKGEGVELLLDRETGTILARFYNGSMRSISPTHSLNRAGDRLKDEPTLLISEAA